MRKVRIVALALGACLIAAAVALAQATQTNTYNVTGKVLPSKAGTKKHPKPVSVNFDYTVGEAAGNRPSPVKQYDINFAGLRVNGGKFPKCTAATINAAGSDAPCSSKAAVGKGNVENISGPTNDPTNKSITCHLDLTVYNGGAGKAALFLKGGPNDPRGPAFSCPIAVSQAIDANYIANSKGSSLRFTVQGALLHPAPGLDNAVVKVASTIKKITRKVKGKTVGYYESVGGCVSKKRNITVTFTSEAGQTAKAQTRLACTK
jgi:hypothetical protein